MPSESGIVGTAMLRCPVSAATLPVAECFVEEGRHAKTGCWDRGEMNGARQAERGGDEEEDPFPVCCRDAEKQNRSFDGAVCFFSRKSDTRVMLPKIVGNIS